MLQLARSRRLILFFFFQAEDGIRDIGVTGVQTCALPISNTEARRVALAHAGFKIGGVVVFLPFIGPFTDVIRSEERRVGKECRSRWSPDRKKKKRIVGCGRAEE